MTTAEELAIQGIGPRSLDIIETDIATAIRLITKIRKELRTLESGKLRSSAQYNATGIHSRLAVKQSAKSAARATAAFAQSVKAIRENINQDAMLRTIGHKDPLIHPDREATPENSR